MFGRSNREVNTVATLDRLTETLLLLEKKERVLLKKVAAEVVKAKEFYKLKNKRSLKRKKLYEAQVESLGNYQLRIHDQMIMIESAKSGTETVAALRGGALTMKAMQKETRTDEVDKTMDKINEQMENMKQIQEALSALIGAAADIDEDALEAELEELYGIDLEEELLEPATTLPSIPAYVAGVKQQARPPHQLLKSEEDELAALHAEMAL